ncbi:MAG: hypothetical protein E5W19_23250 [Mesorhizobium sp.]|nr:MAG: hypothetical protein E5W19_23250 [Mesorhizobium sp.]
MEAASKIITAAAFSDQWIGNILVGLSPETAAFEAIATVLLPEDMHDLLRLIVKKHRSASKLRHPFAHHRFGFTNDVEDLLLLIDPRRELILRAQMAESAAKPPTNEKDKPAWFSARQKNAEDFEASIMAYDLAEMDRIRAEIEFATGCFTSFWQLTGVRPPPSPQIRDQIFSELTERLQS